MRGGRRVGKSGLQLPLAQAKPTPPQLPQQNQGGSKPYQSTEEKLERLVFLQSSLKNIDFSNITSLVEGKARGRCLDLKIHLRHARSCESSDPKGQGLRLSWPCASVLCSYARLYAREHGSTRAHTHGPTHHRARKNTRASRTRAPGAREAVHIPPQLGSGLDKPPKKTVV